MDLYLYHGRKAKDEQLEDWGFEGPVLHEVKGFHCTYLQTYRVVFNNEAAMEAAKALTGRRSWDTHALEMSLEEDMVKTEVADIASWYGDWGFNAI